MGFFSTLFKGKQEEKPLMEVETVDNAVFLSIAKLVSDNDPAVMKNAALNVVYIPPQGADTAEVQREIVAKAATLQWLELVHILSEGQWLCELDWKAEKDDFIFLIEGLQSSQGLGLKIDPAWLEEAGEVTQWCEILDERLEEKGVCVAAFDIDSDSYVLFIAKKQVLEALETLAQSIGQRIALGKHM